MYHYSQIIFFRIGNILWTFIIYLLIMNMIGFAVICSGDACDTYIAYRCGNICVFMIWVKENDCNDGWYNQKDHYKHRNEREGRIAFCRLLCYNFQKRGLDYF